MIVQCEQCKTKFRLADEKIGPRGAKVRCSKCAHVFVATKPAPEGTGNSVIEPAEMASSRPGPPPLGFAEDLMSGLVAGPPPQPPPPPSKGRESYIGFDASPPRGMPKPPESRLQAKAQPPPPPPAGSWLPPAFPPPGPGSRPDAELPSFEHPSGITAALSPLPQGPPPVPRGRGGLGAEFGLDTAPGPKLTLSGPSLSPSFTPGPAAAFAGPPPLPPSPPPLGGRPPPLALSALDGPSRGPPPLPSMSSPLLNDEGEPRTERASLPPPPRSSLPAPGFDGGGVTSLPPAPLDATMRAFDSSSLLDALNNTFVGPPGDPFAVPEPGFTNPGTISGNFDAQDVEPTEREAHDGPSDDIARIELKKGLLGHAGTGPNLGGGHHDVLTRIAPDVVADAAIDTKPEKKPQASPARTFFLLGVLAVVIAFAAFVTVADPGGRVGSPLDLLGLSKPTLTPGALKQVRTTAAYVTVYPGKDGKPLLVVRGSAKNHGPDVPMDLEAVALVLDDEKVIATRDALLGSELSPDVLVTIGDAAELEALETQAASKASHALKSGEVRPFMVVFAEVPKNLERYTFRVEFRPKKKG